MDHFKSINDRYGHLVGDQAIQSVATTLSGVLRPGDMLCRYGGEEFCILLGGVEANQAQELAERMRKQIEIDCGPSRHPGRKRPHHLQLRRRRPSSTAPRLWPS